MLAEHIPNADAQDLAGVLDAAHYEVLGITEDADAEQVRRAFRRAARTLHPDVNHAPDATQRFQAALAAYEALTDADSRQHYDKGLGLVSARAKDPRFARFERWRTEVVPLAVVQIRLEEWGVEVAGIVAGWEASLANLAAQCRHQQSGVSVTPTQCMLPRHLPSSLTQVMLGWLAGSRSGLPGGLGCTASRSAWTSTSGQGRPGQAVALPPPAQTAWTQSGPSDIGSGSLLDALEAERYAALLALQSELNDGRPRMQQYVMRRFEHLVKMFYSYPEMVWEEEWFSASASTLNLQDLTVVTDIAVPRATAPLSYLVPVNLTGPGAPSITYTNVTLRLPSSCTSLAQYASLLCRGTVNASMVISRGGVGYRTWATAAVSARNLNLTCGRSLPPSFNLMCSSAPVAGPEELLAALAAAGGMDEGTTSFVHVLTNISLQASGGRWCNIVAAYAANSQVVFYNLTHANMPLGEAASLPLSLFTALGFMVQSLRIGLGLGLLKLEFRDCTLLIPNDEMTWWTWLSQSSPTTAWIVPLDVFEANLSASSLVKELRPRRQGFMWTDVQLVSVEAQLPSTPLLVHDTGVLRLNGLGASLFRMGQVVDSVVKLVAINLVPWIQRPWRIAQLKYSVRAALPEVMTANLTMRGRVVFTGHPALPQTLMMDLAAAPSLLALDGPDAQLTLSNLVLANAAPLLSSLVCGAVAQQQGIACTPPDSAPGASNTPSPEASSRAVWRATGLPDLTAVSPLPSLCTPELADALGGLTSLLWFFATPRTSPSDQPPLASAPLVLVNVTLLLPDLELRAIREVAQGGSTRVNLRPDTLDLLRAQLAGQEVCLARRALPS
ncbi:hypothetical protein V8C86DRAFT_3024802 [Haematococcus lacustris]